MKVLHLNSYWGIGGAAIACKRLHENLVKMNLDSQVLCQVSDRVDNRVHVLPTKLPYLFRRIQKKLCYEIKKLQHDDSTYYHSLNFYRSGLVKFVNALSPDIIHLHWVGNDFLKIEDLKRLKAPIVWTLHDMWPFCGAEHIAYEDERWINGYFKNNRSPLAKGLDLNRWVFNRKRKAWKHLSINTISVSNWMHDCVSRSKLFSDIDGNHTVIHNGLDETVFTPHGVINRIMNGRCSRFRICFGAAKQDSSIKGGDLLKAALRVLVDKSCDIELVTFGDGGFLALDGVSVTNVGRVHDIMDLAEIYRSSDLMLIPSRLESFGQTAAEALACGTPVVCFDTSGLRDVVVHKETGYRARCYDPYDLAEGILWCLKSSERLKMLAKQSRMRVVNNFKGSDVASETFSFYKKVLGA